MSVSALAVPSLDLPAWDFLQHIHVTLRTLSSYLSEKLPLTKFPAGNFTDPKAIHDFDFYISQMDNQLLEGEHSWSIPLGTKTVVHLWALKQCQDCGYSC